MPMSPVPITIYDDHLAGLPAPITPMVVMAMAVFDDDNLRPAVAMVTVMAVVTMPVIFDHDDVSAPPVPMTVPAVCVGSHAKGEKPD